MVRLALFLGFCLSSAHSLGQLPQIRIDEISPASGQIGHSFPLRIHGGKDLDECGQLRFSHPGITSTATDAEHTFLVNVAADVPAGLYEARALGLFGISNPRSFAVSPSPHTVESDSHQNMQSAQVVSCPTTVTARCAKSAETDWYTFDIAKDESIRLRIEASTIGSLLQPVMEIFDESGRRLAKARRKRQQDAEVTVTGTADERLWMLVRDAGYVGGVNYGYLATLERIPSQGRVPDHLQRFSKAQSATPFVNPGRFQQVIDDEEIEVSDQNGAVENRFTLPTLQFNQFRDRYAEHLYDFQASKGDDLHIEVYAHRIGSPADVELTVEQLLTKNNQITSRQIARLTEGSQNPGGSRFPTYTQDPDYRFQVPEDGSYRLKITDRNASARPNSPSDYFLAVHSSEPGFHVVAFESSESIDGKANRTPGAIVLQKGSHFQIPVYVFRYAGHQAPITIAASSLPNGIQLSPTVISANQTQATVTFSSTAECQTLEAPIHLTATSGKETQPVFAAAIMHQVANGLPTALRYVRSLHLSVIKDLAPMTVSTSVQSLNICPNRRVAIPLSVIRRNGFDGPVTVEFASNIKNLKIPNVVIPKGRSSAKAVLEIAEKTTLGNHHMQLTAVAKVPHRRNPWKADRANEAVKQAEKNRDQLKQQLTMNSDRITKLMKQIQSQKTELNQLQTQRTKAEQQIIELLNKRDTKFHERTNILSQLQAAMQTYQKDSEAENDDPSKFAKELKRDLAPVTSLADNLIKWDQQLKQTKATIRSLNSQLEAFEKNMRTAAEQQAEFNQKRERLKQELKAAESKLQATTKQFQAASEVAKPKQINVRSSLPSLALSIFPAPGKLSAAVAEGAVAKAGSFLDVAIKLQRKEDFSGTFKIRLSPESDSFLNAAPLVIARDQNSATVRINIDKSAKLPAELRVTIEAVTDFENRKAIIDSEIVVPISTDTK